MLKISVSRITRQNGKTIDLGVSPSGTIDKIGKVESYDGIEYPIPNNEKINIFDTEGIKFEEESISELIEYFDEYAEDF